jgi:arylsulfatase A-like enzyme
MRPEKLNRRKFLTSMTAGACLVSLANQVITGKTASRPNIIYINVDDLGWADLGYQGSGFYKTPNIDRLASQGMLFTNAYAPAANCAPSRACCLTGQYTPRHGIYTVNNSDRGETADRKLIPVENTLHIKQDNQTIAEALRDSGYRTSAIGKWHVSKNPLENGFDLNIAGGEWGGPYHGGYHSPYDYPNCSKDEPGEYLTDRLTSEAIDFIKDNWKNPFFLYLAYYTVHSPLQAKPEKEKAFSTREKTEAHNNSAYAAMISSMDDGIGRIMATLETLGLSDNTLLLLTSDNGGVWKTSKQWPLRAGKGSYYEGGIREPLVMRWPGKIREGSVCDVPVCGIDFFPTFLEASGTEIPAGKTLDGISLMPLLTQNGGIQDRPLFWHFPIYLEAYFNGGPFETKDRKFRTRPGSAVRFRQWKLLEYFEDGELELYNLADDIGEKHNVAAANPETTRELLSLLRDWRTRLDAPVPEELNPEYQS